MIMIAPAFRFGGRGLFEPGFPRVEYSKYTWELIRTTNQMLQSMYNTAGEDAGLQPTGPTSMRGMGL